MTPDLGFDPSLAAQAGLSLPLFAGAMIVAKRVDVVPRRLELLLAAGITATTQAAIAVSQGHALFPALSAAASGALLAMVMHAAATKGESDDAA